MIELYEQKSPKTPLWLKKQANFPIHLDAVMQLKTNFVLAKLRLGETQTADFTKLSQTLTYLPRNSSKENRKIVENSNLRYTGKY